MYKTLNTCLFLFITFLLLLSLVSPASAKLLDILANQSAYTLQVKELEALQKEARFNYSDAYANYQLDMRELKKQRDKLMEDFNSEEKRREIIEKGLGVQFQLRFFANMASSLINIERRIHYMLMLKDLRLNILDRLPLLIQGQNQELQANIDEDKTELKAIDERMARLNEDVRKITKDASSTSLDRSTMQRLKTLHQRYQDLMAAKQQRMTRIKRAESQIGSSKRSIQLIKNLRPDMEEAFNSLEKQRSKMRDKVLGMKRDLENINVNVSIDELTKIVSQVWGEVRVISSDLGQFETDYAKLDEFQKVLETATAQRERTTLEQLMGQSVSVKQQTSDAAVMEWVNKIQTGKVGK